MRATGRTEGTLDHAAPLVGSQAGPSQHELWARMGQRDDKGTFTVRAVTRETKLGTGRPTVFASLASDFAH